LLKAAVDFIFHLDLVLLYILLDIALFRCIILFCLCFIILSYNILCIFLVKLGHTDLIKRCFILGYFEKNLRLFLFPISRYQD